MPLTPKSPPRVNLKHKYMTNIMDADCSRSPGKAQKTKEEEQRQKSIAQVQKFRQFLKLKKEIQFKVKTPVVPGLQLPATPMKESAYLPRVT